MLTLEDEHDEDINTVSDLISIRRWLFVKIQE